VKTTLGLELFDDSSFAPRALKKNLRNTKCWVAEILGHTPNGYDRKFVSHRRDYTHANSRATRGVYCWYLLDEGKIYEVQEQVSWKNAERYFCVVRNGEIERISRQEVDLLLMKIARQEEPYA
jgi:hypothetical protein